MNADAKASTRFTPERKPFEWGSLLKKTAVAGATGGLFGVLGYGFYTTVSGQAMNNVRAMGMRVGAQFALVAAGLAYYAVNEVGTPGEVYERYTTTGKIFPHHDNAQAHLQRAHKHD